MIAEQSDSVYTLSRELGNAALSINVATYNREHILAFVRKELNSLPLLEHHGTFQEEIYKSLVEIAKGCFGHIELLLQHILTKQRQDEINEFEKARQGSFHDLIADVIEEINRKLSDADIDDLNQLLEWTMLQEYSYTLGALDTIPNINREYL